MFVLSLYAKAFAGYATTFFTANASSVLSNVLVSAIVIVFTAVNFLGAQAVGKSEFVIVSVKVRILLGFVVSGVLFVKPCFLSLSHWPRISNIFFGSGIVFVAYEGFGLATNAAEDMENPRETLPRALYLSVGMTALIYAAVSLTVLGNLPVDEILKAKEYALAAVAKPFFGLIGSKIAAIAALFSGASAINATLYGGANASYMMAKEGELPKNFNDKHGGKDMKVFLSPPGSFSFL